MASKKADYQITCTYTFTLQDTNEFSVDWNGYSFLIIYGHHVNGWFIAIPNWQASTEAAFPTDVFYNTERLRKILPDLGPDCAAALASAVKDHWQAEAEDV